MSVLITQGIFALITGLVMCTGFFLSNANAYDTNSNNSMFLVGAELYGLSTLTLAMLISTLFKDRKVVLTVAFWILLLPLAIFLYTLAKPHDTYGPDHFSPAFYIGYLLPNFTFGIILVEFYISGAAMTLFGIDITVCYICLACTIPLYFGLYIYLDQVIPNSTQVAKRPFFCCKASNSNRR